MRFANLYNFWLLLLLPFLAAFFAWALWARRRALARFARSRSGREADPQPEPGPPEWASTSSWGWGPSLRSSR